ncbi:MAG: selenium-dependent xanthine dehydrogenase [Bacteriovoracaceae bacterium]|nr:selenium-dependent xanthine dehydrogenase [Bacteriovoracaceae bacterium]
MKMNFYLNGKEVTYNDDPNLSLLKYLRNVAGIKTPKDGCSGQGVCGACTVQMDEKAILSCRMTMKKVEGKHIYTTDGLEEEIQDIFSKAFVQKGGIQCGFCTPGIVMSARVLLLKNPDPSENEIKKAIHKNICRCTGYKKIIESIQYAAKLLREKKVISLEECEGRVGDSLPKYEAMDTVLGKRAFVCDLVRLNMHFGALKFSEHPRAKILNINIADAEKMKGVVAVYTAKDIPGERYTGLIKKDWPVMVRAGEETRCVGDVVAGVVAISEEIARKAVSKIKVDYDVKEPLTTVDQSLRENEYQIHPDGNLLSLTELNIGDVDSALSNSAYVSRGTYYTQRIEHAFLETESCLALPDDEDGHDGILVYSQGQGAYEDRKAIAKILGFPLERVRVIQVQNGGGFGGKEDLTVQGHAAFFALLSQLPVKVTLSREESMRMHPKRHPMRMHYELGCDENGIITGLRAKIDGDTGAYASVGMKVLERAAGHSGGAYVILNSHVVARAVYTNNVPCGAMRGFGVNQTAFAVEQCIDDLCEQGGFDRWEFRYNNAIREGKKLITGQLMEKGDGVGLRDTLLALKDVFKKSKHAGIACGIKNTGIGNGMPDTTKCKIKIEKPNRVIVYHGWSEMGQGVHTMAIQTVCQELGIEPSVIEVNVDTLSETVCGMTTSSRGTSLVGLAIIDACKKIKGDLEKVTWEQMVGREYPGEWICDWTSEIGREKKGYGHKTHFSYGYATQVVTLDKKGKIEKIYAAHDAGKIMNPMLFEGQIEGALHMGLGYALTENFPMKDGHPEYCNYGKLGIIRAKDMPDVEVIGIEAGDRYGPYGAKGVGEIGLVPTAAAVACALYQFDKKRRYSLPIGINSKKKK